MGEIKDFILNIVHLHNEYTSTGMYMGLYFCILILIWLYSKDERHKSAIVYPAAWTLLVVYIVLPFIRSFFGVGLDDLTRARTFWALMPSAVIAMGFAYIATGTNDRKKEVTAIAAIMIILAFCGEFKINKNIFPKAENLYKLPQELIDVSDKVLTEAFGLSETAGADGGAGSEKTEVRLIVPYETAAVFRQYDPRIHLLYGEDATILRVYPAKEEFIKACDQMQTEAPDLNFLKAIAKENKVDYILFDSVYHCFGGNDLNFQGYTEQPDFAGDRSASEEMKELTKDVKTVDNGEDIYWDLSAFDMEYAGTYGQYLLYRFI